MRADLSEIVCIVDKSGSMFPLVSDTIGGFNSFVEEQRKLPGEARLTLVLFNERRTSVVSSLPLAAVPALTPELYAPTGSTALLDAVGHTIRELGLRLEATQESERPRHVIFAILTDGLENASRDYTREQVARLIAHQQTVYAWQFLFLAANMDAFAEAANLNIPLANAMNYAPTREGTQVAYAAVSENVTRMRTAPDTSRQEGVAWTPSTP